MKGNKKNSIVDVIYEYLMQQILSQQMEPGDRIPEAKIASEFGVSRTPIREALHQLANDGIITIYPKRYAEVATYDEEKFRQIGIVRISLDVLTVKLAIYYGSNAEFDSLTGYADACYNASKGNDIASRIKMDSHFHMAIAKISKNKTLIEMQRQLLLQVEFFQAIQYSKAVLPEKQYQSHYDLVQALTDRDETEAIRLITQHDVISHRLQEMPDSLKLL